MNRIFLAFIISTIVSCSTNLIEHKIIEKINAATTSYKLAKQGIYHTHRTVAGSNIVAMDFLFYTGISSIEAQQKILPGLLFKALPFASEQYPRKDVIAIMERTGSSFSCSAGIEFSKCHLITINDRLPEVMPIVANLILSPRFNSSHVDLVKNRAKLSINSQFQSPSFLANEAANKLFYFQHPFWISYRERLAQIAPISSQQLRTYYKTHVLGKLTEIVSVSSSPAAELKPLLQKHFASFKVHHKITPFQAPPPQSQEDKINIVNFNNPTAYFIIKIPMPGIHHKDSTAANFMMKILDEELSLEIRTKRSLSYSIYSYLIDYSIGIGVIGGSTSKPAETIAAIIEVINRLRNTALSPEEIKRHKNVYVTSLFLEMEGHSSLSASMSKGRVYANNPSKAISAIMEIQSLKNSHVQTMAQRYLKNMKVGIVFAEDKIDKKWFASLP